MALTREEALRKLQEQQAASGVKEEFRQPITEQAISGELGGPGIVGGGGGLAPTAPTQIADAREQTLGQIQRQKRINSLKAEREKVMGALAGQQEEIAPVFREQIGRARTETAQAGRRFADFLAERGLQASGLAGAGEIARTAGLQTQIGGIREQEAGAFADIARQRAEAETGFQAGVREAGFAEQEFAAQQQLQAQSAQAERQLQLEDAQIDTEIREAQSQRDFVREEQLIGLKQQNELERIRLRRATTGGVAQPDVGIVTPKDVTKNLVGEITGALTSGATTIGDVRMAIENMKPEIIRTYGEFDGLGIYQDARDAVTDYIVQARERGAL